MIVIEYQVVDGRRTKDINCYPDRRSWKQAIMLSKIAGKWAGHKVYDYTSLELFFADTTVNQERKVIASSWDKDAILEAEYTVIPDEVTECVERDYCECEPTVCELQVNNED